MSIKTLATVITAAIMATACNPDDGPGNFEPRLTATGASAVLHTEATLSGRIELQGSTQMPALSFLYGTDESLSQTSGLAEAVGDSVAVRVTGLKPGTAYQFCLLADNGRVELRSNTLSFTTQPSGRPAVCEATDIKHTSATLQGQADTLDNGQLPELAFLVGTESGAMRQTEGTIITDGKATMHLEGLTPGTAYRFCLRAFDGHNTTFSDTLTFATKPSDRPTASPATDITRTSATLQGQADTLDNGQLPELAFLVGTESGAMGRAEGTAIADGKATLHLDDLTPGTAYRFCLRAFDGHNTTFSDTLTFTTQPNKKPTITAPALIGQGPTSAMVSYAVTDNGGEPLTATGIVVTNTATGEQQRIKATADINADTVFTIRAAGLAQHATFSIEAFAANTIGESKAEGITMTTSEAIVLTSPGQLAGIIANDVYAFTEVSIAGPMNGDDLRLLRRMMGREPDGSAGNGRLAKVDMTDATIVEGGGPYDGQRYTKDNVVGQGLFAGCTGLATLHLPAGATTIEQEAMRGCSSLTQLAIPSAAVSVAPSTGCTSLAAISAPVANTAYSSHDGVLLTADGKEITWFPMGKTGDYALPESVTSIGDRAFAGCAITRFTLPDGLKEIGQAAFFGSKVEEVTLPDGLRLIPTATFQQCASLHTVRLGSKAELVSDYAFDGCPLRHIYIDAQYPPVCNPNALTTSYGELFSKCTLHVPAGRSGFYKADSHWGQFKNTVEMKN